MPRPTGRPPGIPQKPYVPRNVVPGGRREKFYGWLLPEVGEKARRSAAAANLSIGSYMERLIAADPVDADGKPLWAADPEPTDQEQLPLAG